MKRNRSSIRVLVLGAAVLLGIQIWTFRDACVDDAYISFRYAQNLWRGDGLSFNPGEAPVEGYSNFLWTVLQAPGTALFDDPIVFARCLGLLLLGFEMALLLALSRHLAPGRPTLYALGALVLVADPGFVYWHLAGLEAPLESALLLLVLYVEARRMQRESATWRSDLGAALAWTALAVSRIDAPLLAAVLALALASGGRHTTAMRPRPPVRTWLLAAILYGIYTTWRVLYYGDVLPNTFHAKVAGVRWESGLESVWDCARTRPWVWLLPVAYALARRRPAHGARSILGAAAAVVVAQIVLVTFAGGDWMPLDRLFVPILPLAALVGIAGFAARQGEPATPRGRLVLAAAGVTACAGLVFFHLGSEPVHVAVHVQNVRNGKALGQALVRAGDPRLVMANGTAGAAPYFSELRTLDTSGLNDRHIARTAAVTELGFEIGHEKGDGAYVLSLQPDLIVFVGGRSGFPGTYVSDAQMAFEPGFHANYEGFGFEAGRPIERWRFLRAPETLLARLAFLGDLHRVPSRIGVVLESSPALPLRILRRTPITRGSTEARRVFLEIETAAQRQDWARARSLVLEHAGAIHAAELGGVVAPLAMLYSLRLGDAAAAQEYRKRARADRGPFAPLLRIWLASRPELWPAGAPAGPAVTNP